MEILEKTGSVRAHLPVLIAADESLLGDVMRRTAFVAADYLPKQCSEIWLRYRVTKANRRYQEIIQAAESQSSGEPGWKPAFQDTVRELSCLCNIAQAVGNDTPLDACLRTVTRLLAQGMRFSSSAVVEIWLDGKRYSDFPELSERTSEISAPVVVADRERGELLVYSCLAHSFSTREMAMVATTAQKVGYTVRRSELRRALSASENRHRRLLEAVTQGVFWAHFDEKEQTGVEDVADREAVIERCLSELKVTDCNLAFAAFHGFTTVGDCVGTALRELFEDSAVAHECMDRLIEHDHVSHIATRPLPDGGQGTAAMVCHTIRRGRKLMGIQGFNCERPRSVSASRDAGHTFRCGEGGRESAISRA
jgi:PAS domain-containing protein